MMFDKLKCRNINARYIAAGIATAATPEQRGSISTLKSSEHCPLQIREPPADEAKDGPEFTQSGRDAETKEGGILHSRPQGKKWSYGQCRSPDCSSRTDRYFSLTHGYGYFRKEALVYYATPQLIKRKKTEHEIAFSSSVTMLQH
jgi:hypothetical protein